jgi:two-component system, chemotaxis family, sensor kinase CheA
MNSDRTSTPPQQSQGAGVYLVMAAMTTLGALLAVLLCRDLVSAFRRSVETNGEWAAKAADYAELSRLATVADAPGNNVFESHDIAGERATLERVAAEYEAHYARALNEAADAPAPIRARMLEHLGASKQSFDAMIREAKAIFTALDEHDASAAGQHMATMDQRLADTADHLGALATAVRSHQEAEFHAQRQMAEQRGSWAWALAAVLGAFSVGMAAYGVKLARVVSEAHGAVARSAHEMSLLLDNASQGFASIQLDGRISSARSAAFDRLLGTPREGEALHELLQGYAPQAGIALQLGLDAIREDALPIELNIEQLPRQIQRDERHLRLSYRPIQGSGPLQSLLVVASDVTAEVERERAEVHHRELLSVVERISKDRQGFIDFFSESSAAIEALSSGTISDAVVSKRIVHTLKGNSGFFGLTSIVEVCHRVEDLWAEQTPDPADVALLRDAWDDLVERLKSLIDDDTAIVEVPLGEYDALVHEVRSEAPRESILKALTAWRLEPISKRFERFADQASSLALRLGKPRPEVMIDDHGVRLPPERWASFWQAWAHVVRNAVDHGLENGAARVERGKSESGQLRFEAKIEREELVLALSDDGSGIDWERVRQRARDVGLPHATQRDLELALFSDGFSTREEVTTTSGRGVGMSAIKEEVDARGGYMQVNAESGRGTTVSCHFPWPLRLTLPPMAGAA